MSFITTKNKHPLGAQTFQRIRVENGFCRKTYAAELKTTPGHIRKIEIGVYRCGPELVKKIADAISPKAALEIIDAYDEPERIRKERRERYEKRFNPADPSRSAFGDT